MRRAIIFVLALIACLAAHGQVQLPSQAGESVSLAEDDFQVKLETSHEWSVTVPEAALDRQVVLVFRARIDNPSPMGSSNGVFIDVNGERLSLSTPRRQLRLLNKPNFFDWRGMYRFGWYLPAGEWRLSYAPDFEILLDRESQGPAAYEFEFDLTDLLVAGENTLTFRHAANAKIAANAGSDMTLYFRDLRLDVREGPGVLAGEPERPDYTVPFEPRQSRAAPISVSRTGDGTSTIQVRGQRCELSSRFSVPGNDGSIQWLTMHGDRLEGHGWTLRRKVQRKLARGRLLISDTFTSTSDEPVGIRVRHELKLDGGRVEVVNFGGRADSDITELNRAPAPWVFVPREDHGIALVAEDDVLRQHASFTYDDPARTAGISDDWFGLRPGESYTMTWGVYATDTGNVFDLVNMIREDWLEPFALQGGINFFQPHAILAYDDDALREHLEMLNINVMMLQGGWYDRKLVAEGTKNVGHGPIVMSDFYADYRARVKAACEKIRRVRPGVKCLVYLDTWIVAGHDLAEKWGDSLWTRKDGRPVQCSYAETWDSEMAMIVPTLDNSVGRALLEGIPGVYLDEMGADGLYWDEMSWAFGVVGWLSSSPDYAHPDGHTFEIDQTTGKVVVECGAPELATLPFKQALLHAFLDRGATVVANTTPTTQTETREQIIRFNETSIAHHPGTIYKSWTYTPVSYAGSAVYHAPGVTEEMFLADIRDKVWNANLYLFSSHIFYPLFTHENLATYQYPITPIELDWGVIIGRERIVTIRPGTFGWRGERWSGQVIYFDEDQRPSVTKDVTSGDDGFITIDFAPDEAAVIIRNP